MNLSILLAYRDRKDNLLSLLTQVKRNRMFFRDPVEVVIVDLGSTENLEAELTRFPFVSYHYVDYKDTFCKAWALNLAFKKAKYDWLFILDVDCVFLEKFLVSVSRFIDPENKNKFYLFEGVRELNAVLTKLIHTGHIITNKIKNPIAEHYDKLVDMAGVGNIVVHRNAFESLTGLDEKMIGWGREDSDFYHRLKTAGFDEFTIPADPGQSLFHLLHHRGDVTYNNRLIFYQNDFVELYNKENGVIRANHGTAWGDESILPDPYRYESLRQFEIKEAENGLPVLIIDGIHFNNPRDPNDWEAEFEPGFMNREPNSPVILLGGGLNYASRSLLEVTKNITVIERFETVKNLAVKWNGIDPARFMNTGFLNLTANLIELKGLRQKTILVHRPSLSMEFRWYDEVKKFIQSP